jgi:methionyl-tRNA synthetase
MAMDLGSILGLGAGGVVGATLGALGTTILVIILIWSIVWKGIALWKSARKEHMIWFIIMLVVNTVGILEILYIFIFSKISLQKTSTKKATTKKTKKRKKKKK